MKKIKTFAIELASEIDLGSLIKKGFLALGILLLFSFVFNLAVMLNETRAPKGIVFSKDNDAGKGIQTATLTRWYNSNHFAPYGNLYFRFAHTLAKLTPVKISESLGPKENEEIQHHVALMLVSLLAFTGFCLFLGYQLSGRWDYAFWLANIFLHIGILNSAWVEFLFRAHPDHLLMVMSLISAFFTLRYSHTRSHRDFVFAALMWGIATAVKRSTILFIPSFLFLFLSEGMNRSSLKKGAQFAGYMLISYMVVGFPQNFGIYKHTYFLYVETFNSLPVTWHSITEYLFLIYDQSKWFWVALIPLQLFFGTSEKLFNWRYAIFCLIAVLVVLSNNMASAHTHHIMPHVAVLMIGYLFALKRLPQFKIPYQTPVFFVLSVATLYLFDQPYEVMSKRLDHENKCTPTSYEALATIKKIQEKENILLVREPYFPFDSERPQLVKQIWGNSGETLDKAGAGIWGTHRTFMKDLLQKPYRPHIYPDMSLEQWNEKLNWNRAALIEETLTTPSGRVFQKIYEDNCGFMIWKVQ